MRNPTTPKLILPQSKPSSNLLLMRLMNRELRRRKEEGSQNK
jgi:hypothetical protein